ncbi:MAG: hypothetical protein RBU37_07975 [Myxococcota bacterium]|jgi:hypothetical protein|nr:hypothetical protein [Myxococcota bacterium]
MGLRLSALLACGLALLLFSSACDLARPEVVVVNELGERVMVRHLSFRGCAWEPVLRHEETSSARLCVAGEGRVHFQKLDLTDYCVNQIESGEGIEGLCNCDGTLPDEDEEELLAPEPLWFNYQTTAVFSVEEGDIMVIRLRPEQIEQDFSVPGPYGH